MLGPVSCVGECGRFWSWPARDPVGARDVGDTEVKENREVRSLVTRCETKIGVVEFVAAMCINPPFVRTLGHDEKAWTTPCKSRRGNQCPKEGITKSYELRVGEEVAHRGEGAHVEVPYNEINMVLHHISISGIVAFLGNFFVNVD